MSSQANYGMDAPRVVFYLSLGASASLLLATSCLWIENRALFWVLGPTALAMALSFVTSILWMLYSMWVIKPKLIQWLVDQLELRGDEQVLDMGCGRGVFLLTLTKKLAQGRGFGIDLWSNDQSGNQRSTTQLNAQLEGVDSRIQILTGDMRKLPYSDQSFDLVVSSLAIHNIPHEKDREQALLEMLRVLKPSGRFCLIDFHYTQAYFHFLQKQPLVQIEDFQLIRTYCPPLHYLLGRKQ